VTLHVIFTQRQDLAHDRLHPAAGVSQRALTGKPQQVLNYAFHALGFADKAVKLLPRTRIGHLFSQQVGIADHSSQRVVQFVRYSGHELSQASQLFRANQLPVQHGVFQRHCKIAGQQLDFRKLIEDAWPNLPGMVEDDAADVRSAGRKQRDQHLISSFPNRTTRILHLHSGGMFRGYLTRF